MDSCSPALKVMVERKMAETRLSDPVHVEPAVLERHTYHALSDLFRTRPRIVEFAPQIALKRALDLANTIARQEWGPARAHRAAGKAQTSMPAAD